MDIAVAGSTAYIIQHVDAGVMLRGLFFMTPDALHFLNLDLTARMASDIGNLHMAAGTAVFSMYRTGKSGRGDLFAMALKAYRGGGIQVFHSR